MYFSTILPVLLSLALSPCLANGGDLDSLNYDTIIALPLAERESTYLNASPDSQARIWTERIQQYRDMHNDISDDQHEVLERFVQSVQQHAVTTKKGEEGETNADMDQIADDAIATFDVDEASRVFASLVRLDGKDGAALGLDDSGSNKKTPMSNNSKSLDAAALRAPCTCGGIPTCVPGKCFSDEESDCTHTPKGCGAAYQQACTGICISGNS